MAFLGLLQAESELLLLLPELPLDELLLELSEPLAAGFFEAGVAPHVEAGDAPPVACFFLAPASESLEATDSTCESADNKESASLPMGRANSASDSSSSSASSASFRGGLGNGPVKRMPPSEIQKDTNEPLEFASRDTW